MDINTQGQSSVPAPKPTPRVPRPPVRRSTRQAKKKRAHDELSDEDEAEEDDSESEDKAGSLVVKPEEKKPAIKRIKLSEYDDIVGEGTSSNPIMIDIEPRSLWQEEEATVWQHVFLLLIS